MKTGFRTILLILLAFLIISGGKAWAGNADFPAGDEGARQLLMTFFDQTVDPASLTMSLKPEPADYQAYFAGAAADKALAGYEGLWGSNPVIAPKPGQTELLLVKATTDELKAGAPAAQEFPGGYGDIADKLNPGHTVYRFKFVEPGESMGMAFDGLVHVNGHWVLFPKPWRAVE